MAAKTKKTDDPTTEVDESLEDETPDEKPTLLRSEGSADLADVPDNTPTPRRESPDDQPKVDDAPAGFAYVKHPKNDSLCLVDEKSIPELEVDGYKRA